MDLVEQGENSKLGKGLGANDLGSPSFSFMQFARSTCNKTQRIVFIVSTKELDEKIEGTYLTELSLEEDVPTNAQSTRRLVLKH